MRLCVSASLRPCGMAKMFCPEIALTWWLQRMCLVENIIDRTGYPSRVRLPVHYPGGRTPDPCRARG